jgi:fumarylacetoacetase
MESHRSRVTSAGEIDVWAQRSWVESASDPTVGFPLQSLPYCAFLGARDSGSEPHLGVGIGHYVLDLHRLSMVGLLDALDSNVKAACQSAHLNNLMRCGRAACGSLRTLLMSHLGQHASPSQRQSIEPLMARAENVHFSKPVAVGNYSDFYASIYHATNVGKLFRPDQPLLPNYKWVPIGYHGRASSLVVSGTEVRRPRGQVKAAHDDTPRFVATSQLDYELELAAYIGTGNNLGEPIPIDSAEQHIFGFTLLNDWSARDIQSWEYQPLGPFLGKSFATTISPWVVPMEALQPFRVPSAPRPDVDPKPLPHLTQLDAAGTIDLTVEVWLSTAAMRSGGLRPVRLSRGNLRDLYWTFPQMVAHHTSNGCNLLEGDLLASGTISGPDAHSQGCLLEITRRGVSPHRLPNGELRAFLDDGDEVILRGFCEREGWPLISFGECRGVIAPSAG